MHKEQIQTTITVERQNKFLKVLYTNKKSLAKSFTKHTVASKIIHTTVIFNLHLLLCKKGWL